MLAKLMCAVLMVTGCSSSAPPKPAAERGPAAAEEDDPVIVGLETEYAKLVESMNQQSKASDAAQTLQDREVVLIRLDELIKARANLLERTDAIYIAGKHGHQRLSVLREDLAIFEKTLTDAHAKVQDAHSDASRAEATAKLKVLQEEMKARNKAAEAKKR